MSGGFTPVASILNVCKNNSINIDVLEVLDETRNLMIGVPSLPPNYLPRIEDLEEIKKLLLADAVKYAVTSSAKQITALTGMGGMGKFVLAAAFARTREALQAFQDGIFWVTVGLNPDLVASMRLIGTKLGDDPKNYRSKEEAKASPSNKLPDKICLIILDDVWQVAHAEPFVNALGSRCKLLITTKK